MGQAVDSRDQQRSNFDAVVALRGHLSVAVIFRAPYFFGGRRWRDFE